MNQATFVGRLVRDVELVHLENGACVTNNSIAVSRVQKNRHGESVTDFIPIVAWNSLAEILHSYCGKGHKLAVEGKMQSRNYMNNDGYKVYVVECVLDEVTLIDSRRKSTEDEAANQSQPQAAQEEAKGLTEAEADLVRQVADARASQVEED